MQSNNPIGIFLLGAPGSGKDYVLKNIFSRFNMVEVQGDQILNKSVLSLAENKTNLVINGVSDSTKIAKIQDMLHEHGYWYDFVHVSVTNKVSKIRNEQRENPLPESKRIAKFLYAEKLANSTEAFVFNNSINLNESSEMEKIFFASQIEKLLERMVSLGLEIKNEEVWDKPIPKHKKQGKLTTKQKLKAKARAKKAGRKYPNMVDNIWASKNEQIEKNKINAVFEKVLEVGTKETANFAKSITPGQPKKIPVVTKGSDCKCGGSCGCSTNEAVVGNVETRPQLNKNPKIGTRTRFPKAPGFSAASPPALPVLTGALSESASIEESVKYHLQNNISLVENVFRPGSENFFELIKEAKKLYSEGKYTPKDEWEKDMLNSDIGELAEYEGQIVVLDYPVEEGLEEACWSGYTQKGMKKKGGKMVPNCVPVNEEDKTDGKGIGKPWREGGGGAVYVRAGDGVRKVSFSKSGMTKKYNDPARVRSFVARHRCLTNTDKTSASYWACRWPRFFSNSGQKWW